MFGFLKKEISTEGLTLAFVYIFFKFTEENFNKNSDIEKFEIFYFLIYQADKMIFVLNSRKRDGVIDTLLVKTAEMLNEDFKEFNNVYNKRALVYRHCISLKGEENGFPGKGTEIFALSYFLHKAAGKTNIEFEEVKDVLNGSSEVSESNVGAFPDFTEILSLTVLIITMLVETKRLLNRYKI